MYYQAQSAIMVPEADDAGSTSTSKTPCFVVGFIAVGLASIASLTFALEATSTNLLMAPSINVKPQPLAIPLVHPAGYLQRPLVLAPLGAPSMRLDVTRGSSLKGSLAKSSATRAQPSGKDNNMGTMMLSVGAFFGGIALPGFAHKRNQWLSATEPARDSMGALSASPTYKLRYFDARAVAEVSRFLFAIADVPYEDFRYRFSFKVPGDWTTVQKSEFDSDKSSGVLDPNMGRLPLLEVDGIAIGQSKAIERFLAKQFGFMGDNALEEAQIDALSEHVRDIKDGYRKIFGMKEDAEKQVAMNKWYKEELPMWCNKLEKVVGTGRWAVGTKFSLADLNIWHMLTDSFSNKEATLAAYQGCPRLRNICQNVAALDGVQAWMQKRPPNMF